MELTGLQNPVVKAAAELKQKKYRTQNVLYLAELLSAKFYLARLFQSRFPNI